MQADPQRPQDDAAPAEDELPQRTAAGGEPAVPPPPSLPPPTATSPPPPAPLSPSEPPLVPPITIAAPYDPIPPWLRSGAAIAWRLLVLGAAIALTAYALAYLRVVVLPVIIALLLSTVLTTPTRWLKRRGMPDAGAAATVLLGALTLLATAFTMAGRAIANQFSDLADSIQDGVREAGDELAKPPFNLSKADIDNRIDESVAQLSDSSGALTGGALHGAVLVGELLTGLIITLLLLFFFLKDGPMMWQWVVRTFGGRQRTRLDEIAHRSYAALTGYVRGLVIVGIVDATLIGAGLLALGIPLVAPLMLLTFLGAFIPLIGAFAAGLAAVLIALVSGGLVKALLVFALVLAVQQVEGHVLYPIIMGRTVHVHPIAVILALATGGILAGIIGVFISVPLVTVAATALSYLRETREPPPPAEPEPA